MRDSFAAIHWPAGFGIYSVAASGMQWGGSPRRSCAESASDKARQVLRFEGTKDAAATGPRPRQLRVIPNRYRTSPSSILTRSAISARTVSRSALASKCSRCLSATDGERDERESLTNIHRATERLHVRPTAEVEVPTLPTAPVQRPQPPNQ